MFGLELIWSHKDHWFEMDIVKDGRVRRFLERAVISASESGSGVDDHPPSEEEKEDKEKRGATAYAQLLWPDARVPYLFDGFVGKPSCNSVIYSGTRHPICNYKG